jgi:hypothetical protein
MYKIVNMMSDFGKIVARWGTLNRVERYSVRQRDFLAGWAKAVALPTEKCGFTTMVGKAIHLPTLP